MERGAPRLSQLPRLMPKLPQRLTPGCIITVLAMLLILMATEPWFPVLPGNSVEVSALVLLK